MIDFNTINIGKITALKRMRAEAMELFSAMKELGDPILEDVSLLPIIFDAYKRVFARRGCPQQASSVDNRKKFLMVVLYLYSPKALIGERMRGGLRKSLSEMFGLAKSVISDNCAGLTVQYQAYADFRRDVDLILQEAMAAIKQEENVCI